MLKVFAERDRVIIDLCGRRDATSLTWRDGERLIETLRVCAGDAGSWIGPATIRTGAWKAEVESYDGRVFMRFTPPSFGLPTRVPLPADVAGKLADLIEFKLQQAAYRMRFAFA